MPSCKDETGCDAAGILTVPIGAIVAQLISRMTAGKAFKADCLALAASNPNWPPDHFTLLAEGR